MRSLYCQFTGCLTLFDGFQLSAHRPALLRAGIRWFFQATSQQLQVADMFYLDDVVLGVVFPAMILMADLIMSEFASPILTSRSGCICQRHLAFCSWLCRCPTVQSSAVAHCRLSSTFCKTRLHTIYLLINVLIS